MRNSGNFTAPGVNEKRYPKIRKQSQWQSQLQ